MASPLLTDVHLNASPFLITTTSSHHPQGYQEGRIHFPPTFKFEPGPGSRYSSQRVPSWTDRILWKTNTQQAAAAGHQAQSGDSGTASIGGGESGAMSESAQQLEAPAAGSSTGGSASAAGTKGPFTGPSTAVAVKQIYYDSVPQVISSDHKPVVAGFEVAVGPKVLGLLLSPRRGGVRHSSATEDEFADGERWRAGCSGLCSIM